MPIYTRTGDEGKTSLFGGKRVLKCEELVDVYGSLDELNSWVGLIASQIESPGVSQFLMDIQSDLFTIGSTLAGWKGDLSMLPTRVKEMEDRIDAMEQDLPALRNFILPGGSQLGALTHVARGICRRVERQTVALREKEKVDARILVYLNRLSDLLFQLARFINKNEQKEEVAWRGIPRKK
jgi:cob(I)alamin adenosyltransferase